MLLCAAAWRDRKKAMEWLRAELGEGHHAAGRPPYEISVLAGAKEVRRRICDAEPPAPSSVAGSPELRKALRGDLDRIVLRALAKDPRQRYGSVQELADDILRHLEHRPVRAVEGGPIHRLGKLVRRRRLGVAAAALLTVLALGAGLSVTVLWQRAEHRRGAARAR